jgi:hypothetical protein
MSKLLITATSTVNPQGSKTTTSQVVYVESDKITILPREGTTKAVILANGFTYEVDSEVAEIGAALAAEDVSAYT